MGLYVPKRTDVGSEAAERILFVPPVGDRIVVFNNDADTSFIQTDFVQGNRFELGYVVDDTGWMVSTFHPHTHHRRFADQDVQMAFNDPIGITRGFVDLNGDFFDDDLDGDNITGGPLIRMTLVRRLDQSTSILRRSRVNPTCWALRTSTIRFGAPRIFRLIGDREQHYLVRHRGDEGVAAAPHALRRCLGVDAGGAVFQHVTGV